MGSFREVSDRESAKFAAESWTARSVGRCWASSAASVNGDKNKRMTRIEGKATQPVPTNVERIIRTPV